MDEDFRKAALDYHRLPRPGKLRTEPAKRLFSPRDLALSGLPGSSAACQEILADPDRVSEVTGRGNLVAVVSNGTAVPGLGAVGALAAKPVEEGRAVLLRKLAGLDAFDLELDEPDPVRFAAVVAALAPGFGAIDLEDIATPGCLAIEQELTARLSVPVLHGSRHGLAVAVAAAVRNALLLQEKKLEAVRVVVSTGADPAMPACLDLLEAMGLPRAQVTITSPDDPDLPELGAALEGADIFLGLSAPRVLKPEWLNRFAEKPLILALTTPEPEILPEAVRAVRPDAIVATSRTDYANQVIPSLCLPFLLRGALDVGARAIDRAMLLAAVEAIAALARAEPSPAVAAAYGEAPAFGPEYILPRRYDPRLIREVASAVARAAAESGLARRPVADAPAYHRAVGQHALRSGQMLCPLFERARLFPPRVVYAEGEDPRVLRAVQTLVDEDMARPILIGRRGVIEQRVRESGLRIDLEESVRLLDPAVDEAVFAPLVGRYQALVARKGVPMEGAIRRMRTRPTVVAAMLLQAGLADAAICGGSGDWWRNLHYVMQIIPRHPDVTRIYALSCAIVDGGAVFVCDTHMNPEPDVDELVEMTRLAADAVASFGLHPKVALVSHSSFGSSYWPSAKRMRKALEVLRVQAPELEIDGEMHPDAALSEVVRRRMVPESPLQGAANLLIMPGLDAANIAFELLRAAAGGMQVGPVLLGMSKPVYVMPPSVTAHGIVNVSALAALQSHPPRGSAGTGAVGA